MMKLFVLMISFLFCIVIFADTRSGFDLPEDKVCVVDVTDNFSDASMASIEVDLTVELKMLEIGGIRVTEGMSPPSNKSSMIMNEKLKLKEGSNLVINLNNKSAERTTEKDMQSYPLAYMIEGNFTSFFKDQKIPTKEIKKENIDEEDISEEAAPKLEGV